MASKKGDRKRKRERRKRELKRLQQKVAAAQTDLAEISKEKNVETVSRKSVEEREPTGVPRVPELQRQERYLNVPTIVGLVIGALGLLLSLLTLLPRVSASPTLQPSTSSSPGFTVSNDGFLKLTDVYAACYMHLLRTRDHLVIKNSLQVWHTKPDATLRQDEGLTVPCNLLYLGLRRNDRLSDLDLAIVVYYRPWPLSFLVRHKLFRFVGRPTEDLKATIFEKQAASELEKDFDALTASEPPPPVKKPPNVVVQP